MNREREVAERAARAAGEVLLRHWRPTGQERVEVKGLPRDLVTAADREAEAVVLEILRREFPGDAIVAEETEPAPVRSGRVWVVDPLDGTVNFAHGIPIFAVSIGFFEEGQPRAGVVHAPRLGETWTAGAGEGTTLNGERVRVSAREDVAHSLLCTGFAYQRNQVKENNLDNFARMALKSRGVRRLGSAALDLAFVASGRYDGYWELWLSPWDIAAGMLLVREAGGRVTQLGGDPDVLYANTILATNGLIHDALAGQLTGITE